MSNKPSLAEQLKQRKQEEIRNGILAKQIEKTKGPGDATQQNRPAQPAAPVSQPRPVAQPAASRNGATQIMPAVAETVRAPFQSLDTRQKTTLIAAGAAVMLLIVCVGTFLIASGAESNANAAVITPTLKPLGTSSADALVQRFKDLDMTLNDQKVYDLTGSKIWTANQAYTFNIKRGGAEASFIILSYDTAGHASDNMSRMMMSDKYKTWKSNMVANVVLLAAPGSKSEIVNDMFSHMLTYLYAPYHTWPTATLLPTQTPLATAAATSAK